MVITADEFLNQYDAGTLRQIVNLCKCGKKLNWPDEAYQVSESWSNKMLINGMEISTDNPYIVHCDKCDDKKKWCKYCNDNRYRLTKNGEHILELLNVVMRE